MYIKKWLYRMFPVLLVTAFGLMTACNTVPYTNRSQLMFVSEETDVSSGAAGWQQIMNTVPRQTSGAYYESLKRACDRLKPLADESAPFGQWEYALLDVNDCNAFALPGGRVAFLAGMFASIENEAELAAIMAHEYGHVIARHSAEQNSWNDIITVGSVLTYFLTENETAAEGVGLAGQLGITLPYSRDNEYEADYIGLMLMAKAGYDPRNAPIIWERFSAGETNDGFYFLRTHPMSADRMAALNEHMEEALNFYRQAPVKYGAGTLYKNLGSPLTANSLSGEAFWKLMNGE